MRTLNQITAACRRNEDVTEEELRYAICAYDVLFSQVEVDKHPVLLGHYFVAADMNPKEYIGPANDYKDRDVAGWHRAFTKVGD